MNPDDLLQLTTEIVAAHVSNNTVAIDELPDLIKQVHGTLANVGDPAAAPLAKRGKPAVPIKDSITPKYLICLEDGKKLKMLKRHLRTSYNLTPEAYRKRWGLPADYPMVAPRYAAQRRAMAKKSGLGTNKSQDKHQAKGRGKGQGKDQGKGQGKGKVLKKK